MGGNDLAFRGHQVRFSAGFGLLEFILSSMTCMQISGFDLLECSPALNEKVDE